MVSKVTAPSHSATEHHEAGIALASQRRFAEAVKEYLEAARLNSNFSETFYNLGVAYGELGQWKTAIEHTQRAIRLDPKDWQAYGNLGVDYVNSRQYAKAVDAFKRAAELNPQDMTLFVSIGFNCEAKAIFRGHRSVFPCLATKAGLCYRLVQHQPVPFPPASLR